MIINKEKHIYYGFDYLRAIMIIFIVIWHTGLLGGVELVDISQYCRRSIAITDIICFQFLLLAVPVFFLISFFLFVINLEVKTKKYFFDRLERLVYLYVFWAGLWCLIYYRKAFSIFSEAIQQNPKELFFFIACGGVSAFWFLFSLALLTIITYFCRKLPQLILWLLLFLSALSLWIGPIIGITQSPKVFYWMQWWVPIVHLPYVFIAILVSHANKDRLYPKIRLIAGILLMIFIFTSFCEWEWILHRCSTVNYGRITTYARLSVVSGASMIFILSFLIRTPPNKLIKFLSDQSLGIYCVHIFVMAAYTQILMPSYVKFNFTYTGNILVISCICAYILRRAMNKGLI